MRRLLVLSTLLLALVAATSPTGVAAAPTAIVFDEEVDCDELVPAAVSPAPPPFDGRSPTVDVLLLLDGVTAQTGVDAMWEAAAAFRRAGIVLRTHFGRVRVPADGRHRNRSGRLVFTASADRAMATAKAAVGGVRPAGTDVVYLLTAKDLYVRGGRTGPRRNYAVAGLADCIGGIRYPHRAFAIGENAASGPTLGGIRIAPHLPGKIFAHEVAHLLGAHHHYANCAEAVPGAVIDRTSDACTLMFNDAGLVSLRLSSANRAVVRGHAITYG